MGLTEFRNLLDDLIAKGQKEGITASDIRDELQSAMDNTEDEDEEESKDDG